MEVPQTPPSSGAAPPPGELVVVNGRLKGARRPLTGPLTLFGQAPGCEVRLTVEGVRPLHAALVHGPDGFHLRDLAGDGGVLVNDQPASLLPLRDGDEITVGPFRFRLEATVPSGEQAVEAERDALRIQAAAVVAQQTALNEEETRLQQRRGALEQQEAQLAGRLEERRRRLLELQEQTRQEREAFQTARAAAEVEQAALRKELHDEREAAAAAAKQARAERQRLVELRKRLRRRWRRHGEQKDADLARREKELSARVGRLQQEAAKLDRTRGGLLAEQLRLSGEAELARRQAREQGQELALAQQQWEACLNQERAERDQRDRALDARAAALAEAEQTWAGRERSVRLALTELHRESAGLEARIHSQRAKLAEEETAIARLRAERGTEIPAPILLPAPAAPPSPSTGAEEAVALGQMVDRLADQRVHLLEQWQALLRVQEEWRRDREQSLAEMEATGRALHEREQRLQAQERRLDAATADGRQRQQSLSQMRYSLEGCQARLTARELAAEAERMTLTTEVQAREEAAGLQLQRLQDLARRREEQRGREAEELAAARARCEDLRRQYVALWQECRQRRAELARDQRVLAARTLAVEQLRLEVVGKAPHSARAERRMERLQRQNLARIEASERQIESVRTSLSAESERLDKLAGLLRRQQDDLAVRLEEQAREQTAWEERRTAAEDADERRRLELQRSQARREQDEQVIARLGEEVEHVAGLLMEQGENPSAQAA